jgi:hypothetical protein
MDELDSEWQRKGATLSHKTAEEEFGLTWEEIVRAIRAGKLHCPATIHAWQPLASVTSARGGSAG